MDEKFLYDYNTVIASLHKLGRSVPGHGGHNAIGLSACVETPADNFTGFGTKRKNASAAFADQVMTTITSTTKYISTALSTYLQKILMIWT